MRRYSHPKRDYLCDCEGYEQTLLTEQTAPLLATWDFIVEAHDFMTKQNTSGQIQKLFEKSHYIGVVRSTNDNDKVLG